MHRAAAAVLALAVHAATLSASSVHHARHINAVVPDTAGLKVAKESAKQSRIGALLAINPNATAEVCAKCVNAQDSLIIAEMALTEAETALATAESAYAAATADYTNCMIEAGTLTSTAATAKAAAQSKMTSIQVEISGATTCAQSAEGAAATIASAGSGLLGVLSAWETAYDAVQNKTAACGTLLSYQNSTQYDVLDRRSRVEAHRASIPVLDEISKSACAAMRSAII
jgi:hypothetical protein